MNYALFFIMTCAYGKCKETYELNKDNSIRQRNRYYHAECYRKMVGKRAIIDLYATRVSKTVVMAILNRTIQSIVDDKDVSVEFLYFALRYAVNHSYTIKAPMTMHYLINDDKIIRAYEKFQLKNKNKENAEITIEEPKEVEFKLEPIERKAWDMFGG